MRSVGDATVSGTLGVTGNTNISGQLFTGAYTQLGKTGNYIGFNPAPSAEANSYMTMGGTGPLLFYPSIGGFWITPAYTYSTTSPRSPLFYVNDTASGAAPEKSELFNKIGCNDGVDFMANGGQFVTGNCLFVIDNLNGGTWSGSRTAVSAQVNVLSTPAAAGLFNSFYVGALDTATASVNVGGSSHGGVGSLMSYSYQTTLNSGATYYYLAEGWEGGVQVSPGASADYVNGGKLTVAGCGTITCNGLALVGATGFTQMQVGIAFGAAEAPVFPVASTGTLIGIQAYGEGNTRTFAHGVDLSKGTCGMDCFKSKGFLVDGSGNVTSNSLSLPTLPRGTPASYACFTSTGKLISSPSAC
jgi:hypothetical protein